MMLCLKEPVVIFLMFSFCVDFSSVPVLGKQPPPRHELRRERPPRCAALQRSVRQARRFLELVSTDKCLRWDFCVYHRKSQCSYLLWGFPGGSAGKETACNAGDPGSIPGLGRSTGEGTGYPLQYSGLENSIDCIIHGIAKSWIWLSDFQCICHFC